jgi:hypothetical protein
LITWVLEMGQPSPAMVRDVPLEGGQREGSMRRTQQRCQLRFQKFTQASRSVQKVRAALADGSSDLQQHRIQFCQNLHKQSNRPFSRASRKACSFADALILAKVMTSVRLLVYRTVISLLFSKLLNLW